MAEAGTVIVVVALIAQVGMAAALSFIVWRVVKKLPLNDWETVDLYASRVIASYNAGASEARAVCERQAMYSTADELHEAMQNVPLRRNAVGTQESSPVDISDVIPVTQRPEEV